ncbi:hypothetical protein [Phormidium nigroviride]
MLLPSTRRDNAFENFVIRRRKKEEGRRKKEEGRRKKDLVI